MFLYCYSYRKVIAYIAYCLFLLSFLLTVYFYIYIFSMVSFLVSNDVYISGNNNYAITKTF